MSDREELVEEVIPRIDGRVREIVGENLVSTYADVMGRFNRLFVNLDSALVAAEVVAALQAEFVSDNEWYYNVMMWNPAQLPLPRTMDLQISVHGDDPTTAVTLLERIRDIVNETELYGWSFTDPSTNFSDELTLSLREEVLDGFPSHTERSLLTLVGTVLGSTSSIDVDHDGESISVSAAYPEKEIDGRDRPANFLIPFRRGVIPLKHFFDFRTSTGVSGVASENGEEIFRVYARMPPGTAAVVRTEKEAKVREILEGASICPRDLRSISITLRPSSMRRSVRCLWRLPLRSF